MSALFDRIDWFPLRLSLRLAAIATVISLTFGLALAFAPIHGRLRGRRLLQALAALPIVPPPTVLGYYLLALIGRRSPLGEACERKCPAGDRRFRGEHASPRRPRSRRCGRVLHPDGQVARDTGERESPGGAARRVVRLLPAVEMPGHARLGFEGANSAHGPWPLHDPRRGGEPWEVEFPAAE